MASSPGGESQRRKQAQRGAGAHPGSCAQSKVGWGCRIRLRLQEVPWPFPVASLLGDSIAGSSPTPLCLGFPSLGFSILLSLRPLVLQGLPLHPCLWLSPALPFLPSLTVPPSSSSAQLVTSEIWTSVTTPLLRPSPAAPRLPFQEEARGGLGTGILLGETLAPAPARSLEQEGSACTVSHLHPS